MLVLAEPRADVRERFLARDSDVATPLLDPLLRGWERSRACGLQDDGKAYVDGVGHAELHDRRARLESLLRAESTLLGPIAKDFAARSLVSILADRDGVVLHRHGGGAFTDTAALVRLVEGACWSEGVRGTNAIGTALVEQQSVAVLGGAHFERTNAGLFCYATPVRDLHGDTVCVLDVTGPLAMHDAAVGVAVRAAGAALELVLRTRALHGALSGGIAALDDVVARLPEPAFVVDIRGEYVCQNQRAQGLVRDLPTLDGARRMAKWIAAAARSDTVHVLGQSRAYDLTLEPIAGADGRTVALLVVAREGHTTPRSRSSERVETAELKAILGSDSALLQAKEQASVFARTELPVLLLAETGTGKELFARAVHALSPRAHGPFLALNCAAVQETLLASELFGYAPNAFTGASRAGSEGKLAAAHDGTLFLDEVADMPASLQAALLRFMDDGSYYRVGDSKVRRASVRLVCATCRDLPALVEAGKFRQDLFYRIQGACVRPPPLRERTDRVWLAEQLLLAFERPLTLTRAAATYIASHAWPGNVRELKSALLHAAAMAPGVLLDRVHFPEALLGTRPQAFPESPRVSPESVRPRAALLREAADEAMRLSQGNVSEAARRLGVARSTLYRMLQPRS